MGAKPGGGGLIKFMSRAGLSPLSAFLLHARLRCTRQRPHTEVSPPPPWGAS